MTIIEIDSATRIDLADVVKIAFEEDAASPLGERAEMFVARGGALEPVAPIKIDSISTLQMLREAVGSGTGDDTRWVRVRQEGTTGDHTDAYANLDAVANVAFDDAVDGDVAGLETTNGVSIGEVHLPAALEAVQKHAPRRT